MPLHRLPLDDEGQLPSPRAGGRRGRMAVRSRRERCQPRLVATSLAATAQEAQTLHEQPYCAQGGMENRHKECPTSAPGLPARGPCGPTNGVAGAPRWPRCCSPHCAASASPEPNSPASTILGPPRMRTPCGHHADTVLRTRVRCFAAAPKSLVRRAIWCAPRDSNPEPAD